MKSPEKETLLKAIENCDTLKNLTNVFQVPWAVVRSWLRWNNINLMPSKEELLNNCKKYTDKEIAKKYKVTDKSVCLWKKKYEISKKVLKLQALPDKLSENQLNAINGMLLGDGWIEKIRHENRTRNTFFAIEQCENYLNYLKSIYSSLKPFSNYLKYRKRDNPFYFKENHKKYIESYVLKTIAHPIFTELRHRWYPKNIKQVPDNLELNWETIAYWFCDDGSNALGKRCIRHHGIICTNGFSTPEVELLINKLNNLNLNCQIFYDKKRQPMIKINKDCFECFISKIKPYIIFDCMNRKIVT